MLENPPELSQPPNAIPTEHYLLERGLEGQLQVGGASEALVSLLQLADAPISLERLTTAAIRLGAEEPDALDLIDNLIEEGLLVRISDL